MTSTMRAVSNTSPISNLALIGRLDLLRSQLSELWIPTAVSDELEAHPDQDCLKAIKAAIGDEWIHVAAPKQTGLRSMLLQQLHKGEAEAIALASDMRAGLLLIDELEGRALATQAGLTVTGTLGILLKAKRCGNLQAIRPEIEALREKARFFLANSLEASVLAAAGE